ncbi:MAG TPA: PIN domain-containing protein [Steroidobacteraceae bacterium]|nr:PIN domain-containing protein [Steroidobacteraceae bacterium]
MQSTNDLVFVDTNILIYAHDRDAGIRRERASQALDHLWQSRTGRTSVQVLQEFFAVASGKLKSAVGVAAAREVIRTYASWVAAPTGVNTVLRAIEIAEVAQISFWDGMIVAAAELSGATTLFTEDLNDGQVIAGILVVNPLADAPHRVPGKSPLK